MAGAIPDSKSVHYNTPRWVVGFARQVMGEIDLDPCSNEHSIVRAVREYRLDRGDDGLRDPWNGRVYCNPPYGKIKIDKETGAAIGGNAGTSIKNWFEKALLEYQSGRATEIVLLVPNVPDRSWFHDIVYPTASATCDIRGRCAFWLEGEELDSASIVTGLFYWGPNHVRFCRLAEELGHRAVDLVVYRDAWTRLIADAMRRVGK